MIKKNEINMSPIHFIQTQYKDKKMKYCDTKIVLKKKKKNESFLCVRIIKCAGVFACLYESGGDDSGKVKSTVEKLLG